MKARIISSVLPLFSDPVRTETYSLNVSILVVISRAKALANLIDVTVKNIDDRAQYIWVRRSQPRQRSSHPAPSDVPAHWSGR